MKSRFETVTVIGCGKIAGDILRYTAALRAEYGFGEAFIEHEVNPMSRLQRICRENNIAYMQITENRELTDYLTRVDIPTLVISAGNYYLFPRAVVENENLEIINFHNALLPKFPGRNAQSWAIYAGETVTGATWHYVTEGVDNGAIIAQEKTPITGDIKAYELTRNIMEVAFEAFQGFFPELLSHHLEGCPQPEAGDERKIYYSWEIPGGGLCTINDPPEDIFRLLRALDYGINNIFPPARIRLEDGREVEVLRYGEKKDENSKHGQRAVDRENRRIYLTLGNGCEIVIRYREISEENRNSKKWKSGGGSLLFSH